MATRTLMTTDGPMRVYVAEPDRPRGAGVVVIQEIFGVNHHIVAIADRLAAEGYLAAAPHLFHRTGDPLLDYGDIAAALPQMGALSADGLAKDLDATVALVADAGIAAARIGVVGFCMGGSVSLLAATHCALGAGVGFYGGGITQGRMGLNPLLELAPTVRVPWLGHYGDADQSIPVDQVEQLRQALAMAPVPTEIVRYPEAGHAFHCDERPQAYHEPSARAAWARTLEWFGRYLAEDSNPQSGPG
jgi:carboxymethylenebutenolidase